MALAVPIYVAVGFAVTLVVQVGVYGSRVEELLPPSWEMLIAVAFWPAQVAFAAELFGLTID